MISQPVERHPERHLHETDAALEEDFPNDLCHLESVGGEVQERLDVREAIVTKERVEPKVTGVIGHLVNCTSR